MVASRNVNALRSISVAYPSPAIADPAAATATRAGVEVSDAEVIIGLPGTLSRIPFAFMAENSTFEKRLRADLTTSMKAKDTVRTGTLRMLISAVIAEKVSGKEAHELSDDDIVKVLAKESKKRGESAQIYTDNGRPELADKEVAEAAIIDEYLPTPLSDDELSSIVDAANRS